MSHLNSKRGGCVDVFRSYLVSDAQFVGEPEIPVLNATEAFPSNLIPFSQAVSSKSYDSWVHFYEDDVKFERIWNNPKRYLHLLNKFRGVITPDFSVYRDMPKVMQEWNIYRSRAFGYALQKQGSEVIANLRFGSPQTYGTTCLGVPQNASFAVGTHGVMKNKEDRRFFKDGLDYAVKRLKPKTIIVYGTAPDEVFLRLKNSGIQIIQFESMFSQKHRAEK